MNCFFKPLKVCFSYLLYFRGNITLHQCSVLYAVASVNEFEDEKIIIQIVVVSQVCDQNGDRAFIFNYKDHLDPG